MEILKNQPGCSDKDRTQIDESALQKNQVTRTEGNGEERNVLTTSKARNKENCSWASSRVCTHIQPQNVEKSQIMQSLTGHVKTLGTSGGFEAKKRPDVTQVFYGSLQGLFQENMKFGGWEVIRVGTDGDNEGDEKSQQDLLVV